MNRSHGIGFHHYFFYWIKTVQPEAVLYNKFLYWCTQSLACAVFLCLAKICMNQIRCTQVISNQKRMSERIPWLVLWKCYRLDILAIFWKCRWVKTPTLKSAGAKDLVQFEFLIENSNTKRSLLAIALRRYYSLGEPH